MVRVGAGGFAWVGIVLVACGGKAAEGSPEVATRAPASDERAAQEAEIARLRAQHPEPEAAPAVDPPPAEPEVVEAIEAPVPSAARADLRTWKVRRLRGFERELPAVVFTGTSFVTVGDEGAVFESSDGQAWYRRVLETGTALRAVARSSDGVVVVSGVGGYFARTTDAFEGWRIGTSSLEADGLFALGGTLVAAGSGRAWTSKDGVTWDEHAVEGLEGDVATVGRDGALVALSRDASRQELVVRTTGDGVSWTSTRVPDPGGTPRDFTWGRERYWIVNNAPRALRVSEDLSTFASVPIPGRGEALGVAASESGVVVVGRGGLIAVSEDGEALTLIDPPTDEHLTDVACSPSVCAAVGSGGRLVTTEPLAPTP